MSHKQMVKLLSLINACLRLYYFSNSPKVPIIVIYGIFIYFVEVHTEEIDSKVKIWTKKLGALISFIIVMISKVEKILL